MNRVRIHTSRASMRAWRDGYFMRTGDVRINDVRVGTFFEYRIRRDRSYLKFCSHKLKFDRIARTIRDG